MGRGVYTERIRNEDRPVTAVIKDMRKIVIIQCPKCGDLVDVDYTPEYNQEKPYELVCYKCGWFSSKRFESKEDVEEMVKTGI